LAHGYDVPRRRVPCPHQSRPRELHYDQAHGPQPDPTKSVRQKDSLRVRRKVATWDDDYLASLVAD
jgi:hypothetical protein